MRLLKHNNKIEILEEPCLISFEQAKSTKPIVIKTLDKLKVYVSDTHNRTHGQTLENWLRELARKHISKQAQNFAKEFGFSFNKIAIKSQRTRWGSCSSKKNLNFNWMLIFTPKKCIDYVVIHELAHTKEMNHGRDFWDLVRECMPDYTEHKRRLHEKEREIFRF